MKKNKLVHEDERKKRLLSGLQIHEEETTRLNDFDSIHHIEIGSHLYQFYKGLDDYVTHLSIFFRAGLSKGDACLWLVSDAMGIDRVQSMAAKLIPNIILHLCTGQLTFLSADKWYLTGGRFDETKTIKNFQEYFQKFLMKGFRAVRISGDAGIVPVEDQESFLEYEKKAHDLVHQHPVIAVCSYPIKACSLNLTRRLLLYHDHAMVGHHLI